MLKTLLFNESHEKRMQKKNKRRKPTQYWPRTPIMGCILTMFLLVSYLAWSGIHFSTALAAHKTTRLTQRTTAQTPWGLAFDTGNHTWVAEPGCDSAPVCPSNFPGTIGEYNISDASLVYNYQQPAGFAGPLFLAIDASNHIWFTEPGNNALGELIPGPRPRWHQWNLPTPAAIPYQLLFDRKGNLWFSEFGSGKLGFFNPRSQRFVETSLPTVNSHPYGMTLDSHGTIWIAENSAGRLASFTPNVTGRVSINEHIIPSASPHLLTSDRQGHIWYSAGFSGSVGRFTPPTGQVFEYPVSRNICHALPNCPGTHISGIAADKNGQIWFDDSLAQRMGTLNPATGTIKVFKLGDSMNLKPHPHDGLAVDARGDLWCTEEFANRLVELPAPVAPKKVR